MKQKDGTLNIVVIGDWNKMFCTPEFISEKIFPGKEVVLEVIKQEQDFLVRCKCNNVLLVPTQNRMQIFGLDMSNEGIAEFEAVVNSFFRNVFSPKITAYGFNISYEEVDDEILPDILDNISINKRAIEKGAEIRSSSIKQTFDYNEKRYMFDYSFENGTTTILINQHNEINKKSTDIVLEEKVIDHFIDDTLVLLTAQGYITGKDED